jgi:lipopolysaccharide export system permease protein
MSFLFPSKIFYHVFREWFISFLMILSLMIGMVVLYDLYDNFPDFRSYGASFTDILIFYQFLIPSLSPEILNLSLLISTLFSLGTLHRNNEITALMASGINLFQITRPIWMSAILLSVLAFFLHSQIVPYSTEQSLRFFSDLKFRAESEKVEINEVGLNYNLGFHNHEDRRLWMMNRFSERTFVGFGVGVHQRDFLNREVYRILAREAYYDDKRQYWNFVEGRRVDFNPETGIPRKSIAFESLAMPEYQEDPALMIAMAKSSDDLSLYQIQNILEKIPVDKNPQVIPHLVRYQKILAAPVAPIIIIMIAIPFATRGVRTNPMIGISKALGLFVFYVLITKIATLLGEKQTLPPILAAWSPNVFMASLAVFFSVK